MRRLLFNREKLLLKNLIASFEGSNRETFEFEDFGEMLSLGIGKASITGLGVKISGSIAFKIRRITYLLKFPTLLSGIRSATSWFFGKTKQC